MTTHKFIPVHKNEVSVYIEKSLDD
uniref:Uncharacterized protein n=1 Tax=Anguilla anguilla TaxID=7936 RepID=A0A0E9SNU4_ANGAN